jgi:1-acyl-sn-glycerol-3-phosphate acyltransferase
MPSNAITRRVITITVVIVLLVVVTALAPILVLASGAVDAIRMLAGGKSWVTLRALAFSWVYLVGEVWAVVALLGTAPLPRQTKIALTYRLQQAWAGWNLRALQALFGLEIVVEGAEAGQHGPVVVLSRHASLVDTLLPATIISKQGGIALRYVLKRELLADPALDLAGNRLPNVFIDRAAADASARAAIRRLARDLGPDDGVLIYPEGTRFSEAKLRRLQGKAGSRPGAPEFRSVLPPRPGGTLAILEATDADVVVLAHHGLEGLATVREIGAGDLVGSRISVRMWRVDREEIPTGRAERVEWLHALWTEIDEWVVSMEGR